MITMKKICITLAIVFLCLLVGCKKEEPNNEPKEKEPIVEEKDIKIDNVELLFDSDTNNPSVDGQVNVSSSQKEDTKEGVTVITYTVVIMVNEGYCFDVESLNFTWRAKDSETAVIESKEISKDKITIIIKKSIAPQVIIDEEIEEFDYEISSETKTINISNDNIASSLEEEVIEDKQDSKVTTKYQILITPHEGYVFSSDIKINDISTDLGFTLTYKNISSQNIILIYEKVRYVLYEVRINLDTTNYEVESDSDYYSAEIVKPLDYLKIVTKVTITIDVSEDLVFVVNDKEIEKNKYSIELVDDKYVLTYRIDDPNWTPYY